MRNGPLSIFCRVGKDNRKIECSCNISGPKYPLMAINREVYGSRMGVSPGCHSLIKLDDHTVSNSALGLLYGHGILTIYENLLL